MDSRKMELDFCKPYALAFDFASAYSDAYAYAYAYSDAHEDANATAYSDAYVESDDYSESTATAYTYADGYVHADAGHFFAYLLDKKNQVKNSRLAFYLSDKNGEPSNGGKGTVAAPGAIHEIEGPLEICTKNALHATFLPLEWKGEKLWLVRMYEPCVFDDDKIGSLKREIICEIE